MAVDLTKIRVAISGGFGGIGQKLCKELLSGGVPFLAVLDLMEDQDALQEWKNAHPKQQIVYSQIDITKRSIVESVMKSTKERMEGLDMFINCSGIVREDDPDLTIQVNLLGTIYSTLTAVDLMGKHNGGNGGLVVNVSSVIGLEPCHPFAIYTASKHGVVGFTRSLSHEFHYNMTGITFLIICPGITATKLITDVVVPTFEYAASQGLLMQSARNQNADICAKNILRAIQTGKNGSVWICDLGTLVEATLKEYWTLKP